MYFEIQADDCSRAARFYQEVFDWRIAPAGEDLPVEYWRIEAGESGGGLLRRPAPAPEPGHGTNAFVLSFQVDDFDVTADQVAAAGGQVALPKFPVPGRCWQGYFIDTEGNTFGVFQIDEAAG